MKVTTIPRETSMEDILNYINDAYVIIMAPDNNSLNHFSIENIDRQSVYNFVEAFNKYREGFGDHIFLLIEDVG